MLLENEVGQSFWFSATHHALALVLGIIGIGCMERGSYHKFEFFIMPIVHVPKFIKAREKHDTVRSLAGIH